MRPIPYLLIALFSALQALVTAYWMKAGALQRFTDVFDAFYGAPPAWTALAFSIGWYWLTLPLASLVWLLLASQRQAQRRNAWTVTVVSLLGFLSMMYAMYPLHLMVAGII
jgi:hypothetical protein